MSEVIQLDTFFPKYDFSEKHEAVVKSTPKEAYEALQNIDFSKSFVIRLLFWLRGLRSNTFQMIKSHFSILYDDPPREIILGIIGQPWNLIKDVEKCSREDFIRFNKANYAKMVWNFHFQEHGTGTLITTETRVLCTDDASRKKFKIYWFFVRPFSGLVRIKMLQLILENLEQK